MTMAATQPSPDPLLEVTGLETHFPIRSGFLGRTSGVVHAVDGVSFSMRRGETLGLVGESGSGKSTLGKSILRLVTPTAGSIRIDGHDITHLGKAEMKPFRRNVQMVFQDPYSSLNPRIPVGKIVSEALKVHGIASGKEARDRVAGIFRKVGLRASDMHKYANEFSGGQRQRVGIARALVLNPGLIIADEAVSALDVSVQAQVINLFADLQAELGLSYLFIAHDLSIVAQVCDRIAVMYLGQIVEIATRHELFRAPKHPYTKSLMDSIPVPHPSLRKTDRLLLSKDVPSAVNPPSGCRFHTRCPMATPECSRSRPPMKAYGEGHSAACFNV
ncbi:ABC transporter ATP-binding protein [Marinovum sp.]|uniref:ABC transporter ATP-binding protein n=1 Tax=Marinovum sp. TaxID=2024839 RepID=UPI002B2648BB|nr:ABC transporter ATP-binding protein [Marinovum sp.]